MRTLILALLPTLLLACSDDTVAVTATNATSTGGSSSGGEPSGSDPTVSSITTPTTGSSASDTATAGPATDSGPSTDSATTTSVTTSTGADSSTSLDPSDGTSSTGEPGTTTDDTTTGGVVGCGMEGPEVDATLTHVGEAPGCGALTFEGTNVNDSPGPVYALDGCPCGANCLQPDPWTFTLGVPKDWAPGKLPACPRIVVERQMSKAGCELVGVSIWDTQEPGGTPARFHAGSLLGPIAAAQGELKIEEIVAETCDCDNCCSAPTRLDLKFTALGDSITLAEGAEGTLANNESSYDVKSLKSHYSGICDDAAHIDWVMRRK